MDRQHSGLGGALAGGLRLSSDEARLREQTKEAERATYRRQYWQKYAKKVRRVFGTLTLQEHAEAKARAEAAERTVWVQIWAEACAYRNGDFLATPEIEAQQQQLINELRRIGNNLNQLARLGHIEARKSGGVMAPENDRIGCETLKLLTAMEVAVARFSSTPIRKSGDDR